MVIIEGVFLFSEAWSSPMKRILLLLAPIFCLATSADAARIYQLVNYPDLQNGHTLSGTITTTDDAPDDSLLEEHEVLAWQWDITGPNNHSASHEPPPPFETVVSIIGISISTSAIELPRIRDSQLLLSRQQRDGGIVVVRSQAWFTRYDDVSDTVSLRTAASLFDYDLVGSIWSSEYPDPELNGSMVIATLVPEPSCVALLTICSLMWFDVRRRGYLNT